MPSKYSNRQKENAQLGMPFTTASLRLHRHIMLMLAKECGRATCFQCSKEITTVEEFSIEHKKPWLDVDLQLFWDLNNIAFSHAVCNKRAGRKPTEWSEAAKEGYRNKIAAMKSAVPEGMAWCGGCQTFEPVEKFSKLRSRWNGLQKRCKKSFGSSDSRGASRGKSGLNRQHAVEDAERVSA
jgi:hypothetical protein